MSAIPLSVSLSIFIAISSLGFAESSLKIFKCDFDFARANHVELAHDITDEKANLPKENAVIFQVYRCAEKISLDDEKLKSVKTFISKHERNLNLNQTDDVEIKKEDVEKAEKASEEIIEDASDEDGMKLIMETAAIEAARNKEAIQQNLVGLHFKTHRIIISSENLNVLISYRNEELYFGRLEPLINQKDTGLFTLIDMREIHISKHEHKILTQTLFSNDLIENRKATK